MWKVVLIAVVVGGCLIWFGIQEYRVGSKASSEPVPVELADLEAGAPLPGNHIRVGLHHCMYASSVIEYESDDGRMRPSAEVNWTYSPLISDKHPYMQKLRELEKQYGGLKRIPRTADWPALDNFAVLLKSEAYETVKDVPKGRKPYQSVAGLVINVIEPLGDEEKRLIRKGIPNIDFEKVFIVEHGRKPTSAAASIAFIVPGALLVLVPPALMLRRLARRSDRLPAGDSAAPPAPAPDPAAVSDTDTNPYRAG
jgi:hypothetical protein